MANKNRDEFRAKTKRQIAARAGWLCSNPSCRHPTVGATSDGEAEISVGVAAHICAAAPGGPRYDPSQTTEQRRAADNGIWLCERCGTAVDSKDPYFTVDLLRAWKADAQRESWQRVLRKGIAEAPASARTESILDEHLRTAAAADLEVFRRSGRWPATSVPLALQVPSLNEPVSASVLAAALAKLDDLVLVAPPGMGKTSALFQIAEAALASGSAYPIVVLLNDWSTENASLLESIVKRPAFRGISEDDLRTVASKRDVILLLDGWNEIDSPARKRVAVQLAQLQAELPELSVLVSTRQQSLDVPIDGTRIELLPLNKDQQILIANALRGDAGERIVYQARRTAGIRELVAIPLYLKALLVLPEGTPFPETKEELLRRFVTLHEKDIQRAQALAEATQGLHSRYLEGLATTATRAMSVTLPDTVARRSISETNDLLVAEGQIAEKLQPRSVLEALVSHHLLLHTNDPVGYAFPHQQFQEWFASDFVERMILASVGDNASRVQLKRQLLDKPVWEEAVLFACERLARGDPEHQEGCAAAILAALEVDPMFAADMIARTTDSVWARIASTVQPFVKRWHTPGKVDRALHLMIRSGRPEFLEQVWPLITHEDDQVRLPSLRAGTHFRASILGDDAPKLINKLTSEIRKSVLREIAFEGDMDGLDLAASVAKDDQDSELKAAVAEALSFRRADLHLVEVLRSADDRTFDLVVSRDLIDETTDQSIAKSIGAARDRQKQQASPYDQLRVLLNSRNGEDRGEDVTAIIAGIQVDKNTGHVASLLHGARTRYADAIADGILHRVREGRELFYGADEFLAFVDLSLEDGALLEIALSETDERDKRSIAAASVLGPEAVGQLITCALEAKNRLRDTGRYDEAAARRYHALRARIAHAPPASLIAAVCVRSASAGNIEIADLAELIAQYPSGENGLGRAFDENALLTIQNLAEDWGNKLLMSGDATRLQLSAIASLVSRSPSVSALPLLERLLNEELRCYREFTEEAKATNWRSGGVTDEARTRHTLEYQRAFNAIDAPETSALMRKYLRDEYFGEEAARVLAARWTKANESSDTKVFRSGPDFSRVGEKRVARAHDPTATSAEAEAIFEVIETLISNGTTEEQKRHAVALATVAARLPHGERDATIQRLISVAPRRARVALLRNLILSGESIDIRTVKQGIAELLEAARARPWILSEDGYELRTWLQLLPFVTPASDALDVLRGLPDRQRRSDYLEEVISGLGVAPGDGAEKLLFQLAESFPALYGDHTWRDAIMRRGTVTSARQFIDLAANGAFDGKEPSSWHVACQLGAFFDEYPELRKYVYQLLEDEEIKPGQQLLGQAVAENPDAEGLLLLVKLEIQHKRNFTSRRTVEKVVTEQVPVENWEGAYNVVPTPTIELRRKLLAMTNDGGPADVAARCLSQIDEIRDEYGTPTSEPRHPDLESGKQWPIVAADQTAIG